MSYPFCFIRFSFQGINGRSLGRSQRFDSYNEIFRVYARYKRQREVRLTTPFLHKILAEKGIHLPNLVFFFNRLVRLWLGSSSVSQLVIYMNVASLTVLL